MKSTKITVCIDLLFCLVILPAIIMLVPVDKWYAHNAWFLVTFVAYLYLLYFIYRKSNIPSLIMQRRYAKVAAVVAVLVFLTILVGDFPQSESVNRNAILDLATRQRIRRQTVWFFFLIVTGFSLSIELTIELFRQIISRQQIEAEKNKAELALYKAQINPHFLFNTLNALYGLVITKSEKTESAFMKFSNILRYMYAHTNSVTIPVSSEIDYIRQYVDLQSLRLNRHTRVEFDVRMDERDVMKTPPQNEPAIGIENCRKRLELLYADRFTLDVSQRDHKFYILLTIKLQ